MSDGRVRVLAVLAVLVLAFFAGGSGGAGVSVARPVAARQLCTTGRTVLANNVVRLVRGPARDEDTYRFGFYACDPQGKGRSVFVFDGNAAPSASRLAGRFVVTDDVFCDIREPFKCQGSVSLYDAVRRRFRSTRLEPDDGGWIPGADSMLVTARGTAAWIRDTRTGERGQDVWVWPLGGRPRVVANGPAIVVGSLAVAGQTLYWQDSGQARSIVLPR